MAKAYDGWSFGFEMPARAIVAPGSLMLDRAESIAQYGELVRISLQERFPYSHIFVDVSDDVEEPRTWASPPFGPFGYRCDLIRRVDEIASDIFKSCDWEVLL